MDSAAVLETGLSLKTTLRVRPSDVDRVAWRRAGDGQKTAAQLLFVLTACGRRADCKKADGFEALARKRNPARHQRQD